MGCCESKIQLNSSMAGLVKDCIEKNNQKLLIKLIQAPSFLKDKSKIISSLDEPISMVQSFRLNALAYALFLGRTTLFKLLHNIGCSLSVMETLLKSQKIPPIFLICCKGYSELLSYYLPFYCETHLHDKPIDKIPAVDYLQTIDLELELNSSYTALQMAVLYNHISIITVVFEYFKKKIQVPFELDLEYRDEKNGENCALIACRCGNYPMVKFLHQSCAADFKILNAQGENAVQVACAASRVHKHLLYNQIITFLIDIVGIDVKYNYEETLLLLIDHDIIGYIEKKLHKAGIRVKKLEIEKAAQSPLLKTSDDYIENVDSERQVFMTMFASSNYDQSLSSQSHDHSVNSLYGSCLSEFHK